VPTDPVTFVSAPAPLLAGGQPPPRKRGSDPLIGESDAMHRLRAQLAPFAKLAYPVLIEGESGTGKELVASRIRTISLRREHPYLVLNCAALAPSLVESMLFGHVKGAFTGAAAGNAGYFEAAADGTLFLDEIGELPLEAQAKLLRVLESGEYQRVGDTRPMLARARIVSATNRDLRADVRKGRFRADLYHRLSVFTLRVPPVRERGEDRLLLLDYFARACAHEAGAASIRLDARATAMWMNHDFPGNVRELRNIVIRLSAQYPGSTVDPGRLQDELREARIERDPLAPMTMSFETARAHLLAHRLISLDQMLEGWERTFVEAALSITGQDLTQAAHLLGVRRTTLYSRMQHFHAPGTTE